MKTSISIKTFFSSITLFAISIVLGAVHAVAAQPVPKQINFQEAATPVMHQLIDFHNMLLVIITVIAAFVLLLLVYVMIRYNSRMNPVPSKTTHHTMLEVVWTFVPVLILLVIVFPSIKLLYFMENSVESEMTVKVTGHQWYWSYTYPQQDPQDPDQENVKVVATASASSKAPAAEVEPLDYESRMIPTDSLKPGQLRLLEVDNRLVVPVNTKVKLIITAGDVLHSFAVPAFGVKRDAVPGRLNEAWIEVEKEGVYYGQCSELCGRDHGYMPIAVQVVSKEKYKKWLDATQKAGAYVDVNTLS